MFRFAPLTVIAYLSCGTLACGENSDLPSNAGAGGAESAGSGGVESARGGSFSAGAAGGSVAGAGAGESSPAGASLLVFSRTVGYRHDSISAGLQALSKLANEHAFQLTATEDASTFSDAGLAGHDAVIFLSTTGDVLDDAQQAAFERFVRSGKGFIGIHSATDTEYDWAWYGGLVGANFREHPAIQTASLVVEDSLNPATVGLPNPWQRTDEWYAFKTNPRAKV